MFNMATREKSCSDLDSALQYASCVAGYDELRPFQTDILKAFAAGRDCFLCVPTGSGKSVVFELAPYVSHFVRTQGRPDSSRIDTTALVVSPLVSLMRTQCAELQEKGISAAFVSDIEDKEDASPSAGVSISEVVTLFHRYLWNVV